jgi:hypothetical protein
MLPFLYGVVTSSSSASSPSGPWVAPELVCRLVVTLRAQRVLQNQPFVHWAPRSSQKKHSSSSPKKATCMLVGKHCRERAEKICVYINEHKDSDNIVPRFVRRRADTGVDIEIDDTLQMAPDGSGMVMFTSGTGLPKGGLILHSHPPC